MCLSRLITSGFSCADDATWSLTKVGVSEQLLTKVIGSEYPNAQALVDDKVSHAEASIYNTAVSKFKPTNYHNSIIDTRVVGDKYDGIKAAVSKFQGFIFETDQDRGDLSVSLQINSVSIQVDYTGTITLKIYNLTNGVEVLSQDVSVTAGELTTVSLDTTITGAGRQLKVAVGYDRTGVPAYNYRQYHDCLACKIPKCGRYLYGYGAEWDAGYTNIQRTGHMAGLSIDYSLVCNYESLVCANKQLFGEAFLYRVAADLMMYGLTSMRWNDTETEKMQRQLSYFDAEYNRLMDQALNGVRLPNNECYGCKARFGTKTMTP